MSLPIMATPNYELTLPSTGETITYRPFLVKEEKLLLMASEGGDDREIIGAIKNIIESCLIGYIGDVSQLPSFDIEYMFLHIRSKSVGEVVDMKYRHKDSVNQSGDPCSVTTDISIDIADIQMSYTEGHTNKIQLNDTVGIVMRYPTIDIIQTLRSKDGNTKQVFEVVLQCVESIWDGDKVFTDFNMNELNTFIDSLDKQQFQKVTGFFETMPKLRHKVVYMCPGCKETTEVTLEGLKDFFT